MTQPHVSGPFASRSPSSSTRYVLALVIGAQLGALSVTARVQAQSSTTSAQPGLTLFRGSGTSPYRPDPHSAEWIAWERPRIELYPERESPYPFVRSDRDPVRLEVMGGVNAPLGIELTLRLAILQHLLLTASAGVVTFGGAARDVAAGYVSAEAADSALLVDGALVLRVGLGVRIVEGYLADAMRNFLMCLGWSPPGEDEIVSWETIMTTFRLEDVQSDEDQDQHGVAGRCDRFEDFLAEAEFGKAHVQGRLLARQVRRSDA